MLTIVLIVAILVATNALYVAAEFAAVSASTSRIQGLADDGVALARRLVPYLRDAHALDRYIAACQVGITVSSLVLGAYGQATLAPALAPAFAGLGGWQDAAALSVAGGVVLIGLTAFQMLLGELVPKSVALQFPTQVALWTVLPMQWSLRLMAWFIVILNGSGTLVLNAFGFRTSGHRHIHSPEEIEYLLAESRAGGLLKPHEHRRLRRALRLGAMRLDELLVPRVRIAALALDTPADEALRLVRESPFTRMPVYRETIDDVVGIVHVKDVARRAAEKPGAIDIASLLRPVLTVPASLTADQLLARMREERAQLAIVLDEFGGTAGLVTIDDVLEQVVGDIVDERKPRDPVPERLPDGRVRLPGGLRLTELEAYLGVPWEARDANTVGGAVFEAFGRLPVPGERITLDGVVVEVERIERHAVASVLAAAPERRFRARGEGEAP